MNIFLESALHDTNVTLYDALLPDIGILPQPGNIIYYNHMRFVVLHIIFDYDYDKISIWVKDCN